MVTDDHGSDEQTGGTVDGASPATRNPVVLIVPGSGDLLQVGRKVTDSAMIEFLSRHTQIADDETAI